MKVRISVRFLYFWHGLEAILGCIMALSPHQSVQELGAPLTLPWGDGSAQLVNRQGRSSAETERFSRKVSPEWTAA
jgi:hypothetical protein